MIKDEIFLGTVFTEPPESSDLALQRLQVAGRDPDEMDMIREATMTVPDDQIAKERLRLAGIYPTDLISMVFKSAAQLEWAFAEMGWSMDKRLLMDSGRRRHYVAHMQADNGQGGKYVMALILEEAPSMLRISNARMLAGASAEWMEETRKLMVDGCGELEQEDYKAAIREVDGKLAAFGEGLRGKSGCALAEIRAGLQGLL